VLEVQPDSPASDIKKAYHRLARERHPDRHISLYFTDFHTKTHHARRNGNTPESVAAFQELEAAYKVRMPP
jgi:DnaJ-class molecular chaperone